MAQGIVQVTRTDVSPAADSGFHDVDCSAIIAAGAEGVILEIVNTSANEYNYDVRKEGSTDDFRIINRGIEDTGWTIRAVGVDGSRVFEAAIQNAAVEIYLVGYVPDGAGAFLTNMTDKSTATAGSFVDVDISGDTGGDTAKVACLFIHNTSSSSRLFALREEGSTDDRYTARDMYKYLRYGAFMSTDASEVFEQEIESAAVDLYLVGWINTGYAASWANAKAAATETTGSYVETELADIGASSNGAFFFIGNAGDGNEYKYGIRNADLSHDNYYDISEMQYGYVACNASKKIDQKLENTNQNLYYWGYVQEGIVSVTITVPAASAVDSTHLVPTLVLDRIFSSPLTTIDMATAVPTIHLGATVLAVLATIDSTGFTPTFIIDRIFSAPLTTIDGATPTPTLVLDVIFSAPLTTVDGAVLTPSMVLDRIFSAPLTTIDMATALPTIDINEVIALYLLLRSLGLTLRERSTSLSLGVRSTSLSLGERSTSLSLQKRTFSLTFKERA